MNHRRIIWDVEKLNRLWDYKAKRNEESSYFGYQVGGAIVYFCRFLTEDLNKCNVLDYGSGKGHIIKKFIEEGINVTGVEMSTEEMELVNEKYATSSFFHGVKPFDGGILPFDNDEFDLITCTECIEHILDIHLDNILDELYRVLTPNGIILFTTPNSEDMEESEVLCPSCNTIFHIHGHVRSFSTESIIELMEKHGYRTVLCDATDFAYIQRMINKTSIMDMSVRQLGRKIERMISCVLNYKKRGSMEDVLFKRYLSLKRKPHLFYVGTKRCDINNRVLE